MNENELLIYILSFENDNKKLINEFSFSLYIVKNKEVNKFQSSLFSKSSQENFSIPSIYAKKSCNLQLRHFYFRNKKII